MAELLEVLFFYYTIEYREMIMKKILLLLGMVMLLMLTACGGSKEGAEPKKEVKKIGMVLNLGGLGDKSFNDSAYAGLTRAKEDYDIDFSYVEPTSLAEFSQFLDDYASGGYDMVIAIGFDMETPLNEVAPNYPDTKFVVVDAVVDQPNVTSVLYNVREGAFMAGSLAGLMTETDKIGYIGGIDMAFLNDFRDGYIAGAKHVNPNVEAVSLYVGGVNPFNDPAKAKEQALSLKDNGVDIIFAAAGGSGRGLMEAVNENENLYAIGIDSDQDAEVEGKVLTSMMKRVDNTLYAIVGEFIAGELTSGVHVFGLAEEGVSTTEFTYTKDLIGEEKLNKLEEIKQEIINGDLVVE